MGAENSETVLHHVGRIGQLFEFTHMLLQLHQGTALIPPVTTHSGYIDRGF